MTMKQFLKYMCLVMLIGMTAVTGQARVINIDVSKIKGDLTQELRAIGDRVAISDTVVLDFGKGTYTIDGTIQYRCNAIIRGQGCDKTTLIFDNGHDRSGFKAFKDDSFINILGRKDHTISVSISDMSFKLKDHKGIWWQDSERFAIKIYHASRVDIHNVDSYMANANITNFDLRVCSNVSVTDCNITNFNNSKVGGCLWLRGEMHNVQVKSNKFYKYGNDETLAVFDRLVDNTRNYIRGKATRTDIFIEGNEFYYGGYKGKDKDESAFNEMMVSLITDHKKSDDPCITRNFHLDGNTFYINDKCTRSIYISFDPADIHSDIYVNGNTIINSALNKDEKYYRQDIEVNDLSHGQDTIYIANNTVKNSNPVMNKYNSNGYSFLLMQGGNVCLEGNKIVSTDKIDRSTGKSTGVQLVWAGAKGGIVTMRDNVIKGLKYISTVGAGSGTPSFTLNATNNYFSGDTRIYCDKITQLNLNFTNNTFDSNNANFFLQEFASKGTLVFNNNVVTVSEGGGRLMTHWNKNSLKSMRFDRLEVKNNTFKGINTEADLFKYMTNVGKRQVKSNRIKP